MAHKLNPVPDHIADAAVLAAKANHYLVTIHKVSRGAAEDAWQVLVNRENAGDITSEEMDLAAILLEQASGGRFR